MVVVLLAAAPSAADPAADRLSATQRRIPAFDGQQCLVTGGPTIRG
jgi:hypothetical protein